MQREVALIMPPPPHHWVGDGFKVHTFFPSQLIPMERMSPFIMFDYNAKMLLEPTDKPRGVDVHPHRGFETVSIVFHGAIAHHDSAGNKGVIYPGDVQWMSAAAGVLHKEYHEREFSQKGGWYQMIQLWVNLPSKHKMEAPSYQEITNATMPLHRYEQGSELKIIAGSYLDKKSTTHTYTAINMYVLDVKKGDNCVFDLPETHNTSLLCIDGEAIINNNTTLRVDQFALMQNSGTTFEISTSDHAKLLILSGAPIDEPIVSYGPFVMNTREQISEAISDYNAGKFGVLD